MASVKRREWTLAEHFWITAIVAVIGLLTLLVIDHAEAAAVPLLGAAHQPRRSARSNVLATLAHTVCQVVTLIPQWLSRNAYVPLVLVMLLASAVCMLFWPLVCVAIAIGRAAAGIGRWLHREGYIGTVVITVLAVALWLSAMTVLS